MIHFTDSLEGISARLLQGFFVGWPDPPGPETHFLLLQHSDAIVLAVDGGTSSEVGFITAISDGTLSAYIPFLEVLPSYQGQGIGRELVRRMLEKLREFYMVDLMCNPELQGFYAQLGMRRATGMMIRNYPRQSGRQA